MVSDSIHLEYTPVNTGMDTITLVMENCSGTDTLNGGTGNDRLEGGDGSDVFLYEYGDGDDTVKGGSGWTDRVELSNVSGGPGEAGSGWICTLPIWLIFWLYLKRASAMSPVCR